MTTLVVPAWPRIRYTLGSVGGPSCCYPQRCVHGMGAR